MKSRMLCLAVLLVGCGLVATVSGAHAQQAWNSVHLTWTAPGDDSLSGSASQYDLRVSTSQITANNFANATRVTSGVPAPASPGTSQSTTVTGLSPSTQYWFAIKTADEVPNWSGLSNVITATTSPAPDTTAPAAIKNLAAGFVGFGWVTSLTPRDPEARR